MSINKKNAHRFECSVVVEAANGPITFEADELLNEPDYSKQVTGSFSPLLQPVLSIGLSSSPFFSRSPLFLPFVPNHFMDEEEESL